MTTPRPRPRMGDVSARKFAERLAAICGVQPDQYAEVIPYLVRELQEDHLTTAAETLAPHFAAIAHQLSRASMDPPGPADAPEDDSRPRDERCPLYCWCGARTSKRPNVATVTAASMAVAAPSWLATTPRPMTVGQLTAEHIGKRVRVGVIEFRPCEIEHYAAMSTSGERVLSERRTRIEDGGMQGKWTYSTDTPCEVLDD